MLKLNTKKDSKSRTFTRFYYRFKKLVWVLLVNYERKIYLLSDMI